MPKQQKINISKSVVLSEPYKNEKSKTELKIFKDIFNDYKEIIEQKNENEFIADYEYEKDIKRFLKENESSIKKHNLLITNENEEFIAKQLFFKSCEALGIDFKKYDIHEKIYNIDNKIEEFDNSRETNICELNNRLINYINDKDKNFHVTEVSIGDNYGCIVDTYEFDADIVKVTNEEEYNKSGEQIIKYYYLVGEKKIDNDNNIIKIIYY